MKKIKLFISLFFFIVIFYSLLSDIFKIKREDSKIKFFKPKEIEAANQLITEELVKQKNLALYEAKYYEKLEDKKVLCLLCPRECVIENGFVGDCRVRANINGKLYSLVYARPVAVNIDPIEKKPFYHFFPKERTLSIATAGCNLHCINCQNWTISQLNPFDIENVNVLLPQDVVQLAINNNSRIISYTYSEPVIFYEYVIETAKKAKEQGIKNVLVTAAYINEEPLKELCKYIDAATVDLKGFTEKVYRTYTTAKLAPVLNALKIMKKENVWLEISNLIIPDANDSDEEIRNLCKWIYENLGAETPLHFLRFFPNYKLKNKPPTPPETLYKAFDIAKTVGLKYVYIGNLLEDKGQDTICPNCKKTIIVRKGYYVKELKVNKKGNCEYCGYKISGYFSTIDK
ncbi:MAG TPA: AmmeMemoRadiSam system radical SAM enzyme [bacterium]|nr:AmmeMemoRadiSam system radical SAM enzyme [bacterium]HOL47563.1 AmmeMemoRadiSam system radical SAM enzyme [bacterium]HPQ18455.1 AmmeMemoRadiSam system radical SAM enzyme [bacterium]